MITFRALTTTVSVSVADDVMYGDLVPRLVGTYEPAESAELHYELTRDELRVNGQTLPTDGPNDLVRVFEVHLYQHVIAHAAPGWVLHAAAVHVSGHALVFCGLSGAGKTTLTLALAARGIRILSEEVVWIDHAGNVRGLARPFHIKEDEPVLPSWPRYPYPIRGLESDEMRPLAVPPRDAYAHGALPLRALVRLGHGPNWPVYLRESSPSVAMERLWTRSLRLDDSGLEAATAVLRKYGSWELSTTTLDEALALLDPLLK